MQRREKAGRKARLFFLCVLLAACSKHDERYITPWLRVDIVRQRADELIRVGSREERWDVKVDGRWQSLGGGYPTSYAILGEEALTATAALVSVNGGPFLVRPDAQPQRLSGAISIPNAVNFDVMHNTDHDAQIERYDSTGARVKTFSVSLPAEYSDFTISGIKGYDANLVPYVSTYGKPGSSQAQCVVIAAREPQVIDAVRPDQPPADCNFSQLHLFAALNLRPAAGP